MFGLISNSCPILLRRLFETIQVLQGEAVFLMCRVPIGNPDMTPGRAALHFGDPAMRLSDPDSA